MREVYVIGIGCTSVGKHLDRSIWNLSAESLQAALKDSGLAVKDIQSAWFGNYAWGIIEGQHLLRGQVALRPLGINRIPIIHVESGCSTASVAFTGAWKDVGSGLFDVSLAIGTEKLYSEDKVKSFRALELGTDAFHLDDIYRGFRAVAADIIPLEYRLENGPTPGKEKSQAMDAYAAWARNHMKKYGTTQKQLAIISSKNHRYGALNPLAQYQQEMTVEEILADKMIAWPLTRAMCAPIGDCSAAALLCSKDFLRKLPNAKPIKIRASVFASGSDRAIEADTDDIVYHAGQSAYELASVGPEDLDVVEVHDASAFGELQVTEAIGLCRPGEGGILAESDATQLWGKIPVNISGGLESKGHPIGATGLAMIYEIVKQLRGESGPRQVLGARIGLVENGGGIYGNELASASIHILESVK